MTFIPNIPTDSLKIYVPWSTAAVGSWLQLLLPLGKNGEPDLNIGMRVELVGATEPYLAIMDGANAGRLYSLSELGGIPAIDVSEWVRLDVFNPSPRRIMTPPVGTIVQAVGAGASQSPTGPHQPFLMVMAGNSPSAWRGALRLTGIGKGLAIGNITDIVAVGPAVLTLNL